MLIRYTALLLTAMAALAGCALYSRKPLPEEPSFTRNISHVLVDASTMTLPELKGHRFDPSDGLDMTEVAMLAVTNNPELKLARDECRISNAQAFASGLLPDPQLNYSLDYPTGNIPGSDYAAFTYGLSYDVLSLMTRTAAKRAEAASSRKTDLSLLWQEWQVVAQARLLFIRNFEQDRLMMILKESRDLLAGRYAQAQKALQEGNLTLDAVSADLAALRDAYRQVDELERTMTHDRYDLNRLLGLAPDVKLTLVGDVTLPPIDSAKIEDILPNLAKRRPDLLALKAGYESQEQKYRKAVLEQFPAINIGITRAKDTSNVRTIGFGITMNLPIFNRNRGNVAIEKATRQRLYDEYKMRLNNATSEIRQLLSEQRLIVRQLATMKVGESVLKKTAANAETAFTAGNIDETSYLALRLSLANMQLDEIRLEQVILEQRVVLQTLIGGELP